jgi:hypothetical protein
MRPAAGDILYSAAVKTEGSFALVYIRHVRYYDIDFVCQRFRIYWNALISLSGFQKVHTAVKIVTAK